MQNQLVREFVFYFKGVSSKRTKMRFGILGIKGYILGKKIPLLRNKGNTPNGEAQYIQGAEC
ncbi:MAG: hypothetical protein JRF06_08080 [Deltaproteobacteria bacterium]|nr:hypothetical protein [Deltaproteobacteria bacterium]